MFGEEMTKEKGAMFLWARLFFVYGPGQRAGALIPSVVSALASGGSPTITNPEAQNDFVYIEDAAAAIVLLATNGAPTGTYEIGSGTLATVGEVARLAYEKFGVAYTVNAGSPNLEPPLVADITTLRAIGWEPRISLEEGVSKTVEVFRTI